MSVIAYVHIAVMTASIVYISKALADGYRLDDTVFLRFPFLSMITSDKT